MFGNLFSKSNSNTVNYTDLNQANEALAERMDHMMRVNSLASRIVKLEVKVPVQVKNPASILVKKSVSLRRNFAA